MHRLGMGDAGCDKRLRRSGRCSTARAIVVALATIAIVAGCRAPVHRPPAPREPTIADRVAQYGRAARSRLAPFFAAAGVPYPPARFMILAFKRERELDLLAAAPGGNLVFIRSYPVLGASGVLGPKLREGDHQVPEGVYSIVYLNPNSVAHLSLALGYPNEYDLARAQEDGRDDLGGDIMIHGGSASAGCLAVGDEAAEDLFVLAADAGWKDTVVVVSPVDFRRRVLPAGYHAPASWVDGLYAWLRAELDGLPLPPAGSTSTEWAP
jgi:L,D-transpeptidase catalytic domain